MYTLIYYKHETPAVGSLERGVGTYKLVSPDDTGVAGLYFRKKRH